MVSYKAHDRFYDRLIGEGWLNAQRKLTRDGGMKVLDVFAEPLDNQQQIFDSFEEFWKLYPVNDGYRHWPETRPLRGNKSKTRNLFFSVAREGHDPIALVSALKKDIQIRERNSVRDNQFRWMKTSVNWLAEGIYEAYLDQNKTSPDDGEYNKQTII